MEIDYEREAVELLVNLIRIASSEKQYKKLIKPAERLLSTYARGAFPDFKRKAVATPKETLLNLADILTWFLEDTELTHYLGGWILCLPHRANMIASSVHGYAR